MVSRIQDAETQVRRVFNEIFPDQRFETWDQEIEDSAAQNIIKSVDRASRINVEKFIKDLS